MVDTFYMVNCPVEIALLTDSHNHPMDHVLESLRSHKPEIICIAGDFVRARLPKRGHKMRNSRHARRFLKQCTKIAPTYVSLGNHEWMFDSTDLKILASTGVTILNNTYTSFRAGQKNVIIGGLSSGAYMAYQEYCSHLTPEELEPDQIYPTMRPVDDRLRQSSPSTDWLKAFCDEEGYKILLCHHPEYYPEYLSDLPIDLILCGHAHGGQIRIFGQGLFAPGQGILPTLTSGVTDGKVVISRGLSNNTKIPRLFNPEEVVYII